MVKKQGKMSVDSHNYVYNYSIHFIATHADMGTTWE